ncbi:MAG: glycosyltransferase family 4 protein [Anaerolineaceae bacterium]|nr:glycosyltransferase family 4 protein [Anaerolineaceae bacterium]
MSAPYRIGFIIEQALGHITHAKNLQENLSQDPSVQPFWILPEWGVSGLAAKIPVYRSNWTVRAGLRARRAIARVARTDKLDALFFHTQVTAVLAQDWLRRIPGIVSLDATPLQYDRLGEFYGHEQGNEWLERWKWRMNRDCFAAAQKIVTWSEWAKQGLVDEYEVPADKVTVISPGVNPAFWAQNEPREAGDPVKILFVGGNLERKGGNLLLDVFRSLRAENSGSAANVELHLVTKDVLPAEPGLSVYNNILPNSPELRSLYHQSDIFCLPTKGDCFPMVLSEASAASLPVISTCVAAIPEIVREGVNGFLIEPGDYLALKTVLNRLIVDPALRIRMGEEGAKIVQQDHDALVNTTRLLNLLKGLIN